MKYFLLISLLYLIPSQNGNSLDWDSDHPLIWSDFNGPVDPKSEFYAYTHYTIEYTYIWSTKDGEIEAHFEIGSYFDKDQSWTIVDEQSPKLLQHEQLHFDISELHARILREKFESFTFTRNIANEVDSISTAVLKSRDKMEELYDLETNHGINQNEQLRWTKWVKEELNKMITYAE